MNNRHNHHAAPPAPPVTIRVLRVASESEQADAVGGMIVEQELITTRASVILSLMQSAELLMLATADGGIDAIRVDTPLHFIAVYASINARMFEEHMREEQRDGETDPAS